MNRIARALTSAIRHPRPDAGCGHTVAANLASSGLRKPAIPLASRVRNVLRVDRVLDRPAACSSLYQSDARSAPIPDQLHVGMTPACAITASFGCHHLGLVELIPARAGRALQAHRTSVHACGERYDLPDTVLHRLDQPVVEVAGPDCEVPELGPVQSVAQRLARAAEA